MSIQKPVGALLVLTFVLAACSESGGAGQPPATVVSDADQVESTEGTGAGPQTGTGRLEMPRGIMVAHPADNAARQAFFGDLHVHTTYSFDAFAFGTLATPYDAYRYAMGEAIKHPAGFDIQLREPLDFYAVTDHAMFLGAVQAAADPATPFGKLPRNKGLHNLNADLSTSTIPTRGKTFSSFLANTINGVTSGEIDLEMVNAITRSAWADIINAAEQYNQPGKFTTFVAYEYTTSTDDRGNLHRNVIFRGADKLPVMPFSRYHSQDPAGLWNWMDGLREQGIEALAIPHNSNGSNGQMFKLVDWAGNPMDDAYAQQRMRNEPLVEITQIKGTSETHPALSMNDEWADFEIMPFRIATTLASAPDGSYARDALLKGLSLEDKGVSNPYKFGFVGASDTHVAATSDDESNYFSKVGLMDGAPAFRGSVPLSPEEAKLVREAGRLEIRETEAGPYATGAYETWSASGLTGVWAEANTREAIYDAYRRKETFATSGPRIRIRFFGGFDFDADTLAATDVLTRAYSDGVSMGSDLLAKGDVPPSFIVWAQRDMRSAALQRIQVIKGWTEDGEHHEQVYDVACSDGGQVDPTTHRCPDNGASVDLTDCSYSPNLGAAELKTVWQDPDFDPANRAFYYARVLENPTCRWSTWDAVRAGVAPRVDLKATIQERAWSSPIWLVRQGG